MWCTHKLSNGNTVTFRFRISRQFASYFIDLILKVSDSVYLKFPFYYRGRVFPIWKTERGSTTCVTILIEFMMQLLKLSRAKYKAQLTKKKIIIKITTYAFDPLPSLTTKVVNTNINKEKHIYKVIRILQWSPKRISLPPIVYNPQHMPSIC